MTHTHDEILKAFGNKLRVRICGICIQDDKILLVKHHTLGKKGTFWAPPGGGLQFAESIDTCLRREFLEETGLHIEPGPFLFIHEFLAPPLHAIELFFEVKITGGHLTKGYDPEMPPGNQIIEGIKFFHFEDIQKEDLHTFHHIFTLAKTQSELSTMNGYYKYENSERNIKKI